MCYRFINFFKTLVSSSNIITQLCSRLALSGSRSVISNNLSHGSYLVKCHRNDIACHYRNTYDINYNLSDAVISSVVRDVLHMKYINYYDRSLVVLCNDEINLLLQNLCTSPCS